MTAISPAFEALDEVLGAAVDPGGTDHVGAVGDRRALPAEDEPSAPDRLDRSARRRGAPTRAARPRGGGRGRTRPPPRASATAHARGPRRRRRSASATVRPPRSVFSTTTWRSANAATCARWVTHSTWCCAPSTPRRRPDGRPRFATDAGVDLVEHERRRRVGEHEPQREHRPRELAARRGLGQRPGRLARVGGEQEGDDVGAVVGGLARLHLHLDLGPGHRQLAEVAGHRVAERPGRRPDAPRAAVGPPRRPPSPAAAMRAWSAAACSSWRSSSAQPLAHLVGVGDDVGERLAVLAPELAQRLAPGPHGLQPGGILRRRRRPRRAGRGRARPPRPGAPSPGRAAGGASSCRPARPRPRPSASSPPCSTSWYALDERLPDRDRVGEERLLGARGRRPRPDP